MVVHKHVFFRTLQTVAMSSRNYLTHGFDLVAVRVGELSSVYCISQLSFTF